MEISSTRLYGSDRAYTFFKRHSTLSTIVSYVIMTWECIFPVVLITDLSFVKVMLVFGMIFHLGTAVSMRLNHFPLVFAAFYPAVLYCSRT
jgi:hypothetical protein